MAVYPKPIDLRSYLDLNQNEARNFRAHQLAADPGSPVNGLFFYRTDTHKYRGRVNGVWDDFAMMSDVTSAGISANLIDAKGDLLVGTADNAVARKAAGTNGHALFADNTQTDGLRWRGIVAADLSDFQTAARSAISVTDTATLDLSYAAGAISGAVLDSPTVQGASAAQLRDRSTHTGSDPVNSISPVTTDRLLGRDTAGSGAAEEISVSGGIEFTGAGGIRTTAFTGDVTKAAGGTALTIPNDTVTNAKAANMPANTLKGNNTGAAADPLDLTVAQVKTMLAMAASEVGFTPAQGVAATNVQAAIEEVVTDLTSAMTAISEGRALKDPVRVATTANIALTGTQTIDGVALVAGDRVLVKNQTTASQNGIYVVAAGAWSRADDANTAAELSRASTWPTEGNTNQGDGYTANVITTLGTDAVSFVKTSEGNTTYTAGTGLGLSAGQFSINDPELLALAGLTSAADRLPYFTGSGTAALATFTAAARALLDDASASDMLTTLGISAFAKTLLDDANAAAVLTTLGISAFAQTLLDDADAGAALTTLGVSAFAQTILDDANAASARTTLGAPGKYAAAIGNGALTSFTVNHGLNTTDVQVSVYKVSDGAEWWPDFRRSDANNVIVDFSGYTPAANEFRVVVVG